MAAVTIQLPSLLDPIVHGERRIRVEATTIRQALDALFQSHPQLKVHLFDESGSFRQHVLCFYNETNTRWLESLDDPVKDGDTLTILQAVSGG